MSRALVREYVVRMNRGDADGVRDLYHDDALVLDGDAWIGIDGSVDAWRVAIEGLGIDLEIERLIDDDEVVAMLYTERGWSRADVGGRPATGRSYEIAAVDWFDFRLGRIERHRRIRDRESVARQLGWDPPLRSAPGRATAA